MDYILPKFRFYEELKEAKEDYRLKDKIIICDWGVNDFLKGVFLDEFNVRIMYENDIKKEIELHGKKICWISVGTGFTSARPFYAENKEILKKVEYVLIVVGNYLNGAYYGLFLHKIDGKSNEVVARFMRPSHTHNGYIEPKKSLWERILRVVLGD